MLIGLEKHCHLFRNMDTEVLPCNVRTFLEHNMHLKLYLYTLYICFAINEFQAYLKLKQCWW